MNEMKLLVVVPPPLVDMLVPSGTMLQVIVAGAPFPDRGPDAVESQGSGLLVLIINPLAGVVANTAQKSASNNTYADSRRMIKSAMPPPDERSPETNHTP